MILGIDISLWQQKVDFTLLKKQGVEFVIIKCSDGGALDPMYRQNYELAEKAGMIIMAYHWMRPQISGTRQLDTILLANSGLNPSGIFLDIEQAGANAQNTVGPFVPPQEISNKAKAILNSLKQNTQARLGVYTRLWFVLEYCLPMREWLWNGDWWIWLAQYPYARGYVTCTWDELIAKWLPAKSAPAIPKGWPVDKQNWHFWQFSGDKFVLPGIWGDPDGRRLSSTDLNFFNGTLDELKAYLENDTAKPPVVLPTVGASARVLVNALNMHVTPGADPKTTIGAMAKGADGKILESANFNGETWLRMQYEGWMAQDIHGRKYMVIE